MTEIPTHSMKSLFDEIVSLGRAQGVTTQDTFDSLIEEVIEAHRSLGDIHDDEGTEDMEEQLRGAWPRYQEALELNEDQPIIQEDL